MPLRGGKCFRGFFNLNEMNLKQDNDLFKLNRIHQMFSAIYKIEMETEQGTELINTIKVAIKDVIMPNMVEVKNKIISSKN